MPRIKDLNLRKGVSVGCRKGSKIKVFQDLARYLALVENGQGQIPKFLAGENEIIFLKITTLGCNITIENVD